MRTPHIAFRKGSKNLAIDFLRIVISEERVDWIFFSKYFDNLNKSSNIENPNFKTDHLIVEQTFILPNSQQKKEDKIFTFQIPDQLFNNNEFINFFFCN